MPNWATNNVEVYGDRATLERILEDASKGNYENYDYSSWNKETGKYDKSTTHPNRFSFESLVPMAVELVGFNSKTYNTDKSRESFTNAMAGNLDYDYDNWYDWRLAHWGTKWDLDQESLTLNPIELSGKEYRFTLGFSTAWSPACQFWTTLSEKYGVRVVNHYYEGGVNFIGTYEVDSGEILNDTCVDISPEMYRKAGAVLDKDGEIDWDESDIDLSTLFPIV